MTQNYLERFTAIAKKIVDSPDEFIIGAGLSLISTTLGSFYHIMGGRDMYPQMFIILCSSPGVGRRGAIDKLFKKPLYAALSEYCKLSYEDSDELKEHYITEMKATGLGGGSPQGLIDKIEDLKDNGARGFLLDDAEFGTILDGIKNKHGYMTGFNHLFCTLWSAEGTSESFSKKSTTGDRLLRPGTYFGILGYMQKAKHYLDKSMSDVGLLRRLLIIDVKGEDMDRHLPAILDDSGNAYDEAVTELEALGTEIGARMHELKLQCNEDKTQHHSYHSDILETYPGYVHLGLSDEVRERINQVEKTDCVNARNNDEDPFLLYKQSRWEYMIKVASCIAISNKSVLITTDNLEESETLITKLTEAIEPALYSILVTDPRKEHLKDMEVIFRYVKNHPGCKTGDISRGLNWMGLTSLQRIGLLNDLASQDRIAIGTTTIRGNKTNTWTAL